MPIGLKGNSDGSGAIQIGGSDAISISTGLNTTFAGTVTATGTVAGTTGTLYPIVSGTAVASTSGTSIDFTGIPSWVKRITVMLSGVSTNGSANYLIQLGTGGSPTTSGYVSTSGYITTPNGVGAAGGVNSTAGFIIATAQPAYVVSGSIVFTNINGNTWVGQGVFANIATTALLIASAGTISLSGALNMVRFTSTNGTDTFDAGTINILYE